MRLYVKLGYNGILFDEGLDGLIQGLGSAILVHEVGYGDDAHFERVKDDLEIKLLPSDDQRLPDVVKTESFEKLLELTEKLQKSNAQVSDLKRQVKKFEEMLVPQDDKDV